MAGASQLLRMVQAAARTSAASILLYETRFTSSSAILAAERRGMSMQAGAGRLAIEDARPEGGAGAGAEEGARRLPPIHRLLRGGGALAGAVMLAEMSGCTVRTAPEPVPAAPAAAVGAAAPAAPAARGAGGEGAMVLGGAVGAALAAGDIKAALAAMDMAELGTQITLGSVAGFCSGYAVKKVSKAAAFTVGALFIGVQVARYYGLINDVNWAAVEAQMVRTLDADGDGKVTIDDMHVHLQRLIAVLGFNLPSGASFGIAFLLGLRTG